MGVVQLSHVSAYRLTPHRSGYIAVEPGVYLLSKGSSYFIVAPTFVSKGDEKPRSTCANSRAGTAFGLGTSAYATWHKFLLLHDRSAVTLTS